MQGLCDGDGCLDEILLHQFKEQLDPASGDRVVVLRQQGPHPRFADHNGLHTQARQTGDLVDRPLVVGVDHQQIEHPVDDGVRQHLPFGRCGGGHQRHHVRVDADVAAVRTVHAELLAEGRGDRWFVDVAEGEQARAEAVAVDDLLLPCMTELFTAADAARQQQFTKPHPCHRYTVAVAV